MIEKNNKILILNFISIFLYMLIFISGCGDSYTLDVDRTNRGSSDFQKNGVKILDASSTFYDNVLQELFEKDSVQTSSQDIFYFNFNSSHVANIDTIANSSLICSDTGIETTKNTFESKNIDLFLRELRKAIDNYDIKDKFKVAITKKKPVKDKYSTIYLTKSYQDTLCSAFSDDLNAIVRYDKANVKQDDTAFLFYKKDDRDLEEMINTSIDVIFTMLGIERTNTAKYSYSHIDTTQGHSNINAMARLLWEVKISDNFELSLFGDDLDKIRISNVEIPEEFEKIMQAYTTAISDSSSNSSGTILANLAAAFRNILKREKVASFLDNIKNKNKSSLPDFDSYLDFDELDSVADLIYVYTDMISFIKDQNYDAETTASLKSLLIVATLQKYYKIKSEQE